MEDRLKMKNISHRCKKSKYSMLLFQTDNDTNSILYYLYDYQNRTRAAYGSLFYHS